MKWQPIETAPKDGAWVVLGKANWRLFPKAKYGPFGFGEDGPFYGWLFEDDCTPCVVPNIDGEPFLGWQEDIDDGNMPTHWMPLPRTASRSVATMKILDSINLRLTLKGKPYTPEEIDQHEDANRIWATIAECYWEAQEEGRRLWDEGYWEGVHDRDPE